MTFQLRKVEIEDGAMSLSLAKRNLIPFVRLSRKHLHFDKAKVLEHMQKKSA